VIANHAYGLFELAALHLSNQPPRLAAARLAIDALGALVETLDERLGQHAPALRDGLAQIRVAYVQIADATSNGNGAPTSEAKAAAPAAEAAPTAEAAPAEAEAAAPAADHSPVAEEPAATAPAAAPPAAEAAPAAAGEGGPAEAEAAEGAAG